MNRERIAFAFGAVSCGISTAFLMVLLGGFYYALRSTGGVLTVCVDCLGEGILEMVLLAIAVGAHAGMAFYFTAATFLVRREG